MVTRDLYTAWDSEPLKRRSYPRVKDKKYPVFTDTGIYEDPNDNRF
jgi:hypothetical protein